MESLSPTERQKIRKQATDRSVQLAVAGRWDEAITLNRGLLARIGGDVETYNRLGKALSELGQVGQAREAYQEALRLRPGNSIATRNLGKLAGLEDKSQAAPQTELRTSTFIEESGTSDTVTVQAVNAARSAPLDAHDTVELEVKGNAINVLAQGAYLGMLDPKVGMRLSRLMKGGNEYEATVVSAEEPVRVMIQETFQHPSQKGKVSIPQGAESSGVRAYVRKGLMKDEVKLDFGVDDEEDDQPDRDEDDPEGYTTIEHEDESNPLATMEDDDEDDLDEE